MNILIAPDSLKGSLTARQAAAVMVGAVKKACPTAALKTLPLSDGGEGALEVWEHMGVGRVVSALAEDPLGRAMEANYFQFHDGSAWVELSQASGLVLLNEAERNPLKTSTRGTGMLVIHALERGARRVTIGLGGSATNDGAAGILAGLGFELLDEEGRAVVPCGGELIRIQKVVPPKDWDAAVQFSVACDVDNPLLGPRGASAVYGPQKGADARAVELLESGLRHWAEVLEECFGRSVAEVAGGGAAGGAAAGLMGALGAELRSGFALIAEALELDKALEEADVVLTAEGMLDGQSLSGKATVELCKRAKKAGCETWVFAGGVVGSAEEFAQAGVDHAVQLRPEDWSVAESMAQAEALLAEKVEEAFRTR